MPEQLTSDLSVTVDGSELPAEVMAMLVLAFVEDSRALPDAFELRFRDPDRVAISKARFRIGAQVRLGVRTGEESATAWLVDGELTSLEVESDARGSWTVVRGYDPLHRLQRGRVVAAYRDHSARDVVQTIAARNGLSVGTVASSPVVLTEAVQANVSDWTFLTDLARDLGLEVSVTDRRLSLTEPVSATSGTPVSLTLGENLVRFRGAVTASEHADQVQVRTWDYQKKTALIGTGQATASRSASIGTTPKDTTTDFRGTDTVRVTDATYATEQKQVDALAKALAEQVAGVFTELEAVVRGDPTLRSGTVVSLEKVGAPFEGRYVVTTARHVYDGQEGYQVWLTISGAQDRTLLGLLRANGGTTGVLTGLMPAIVTNAKDPDKLGRVKVKMPWLDDTFETTWARTLQQGGKDGGGLVIPEVNDEVLVGFEQGRAERPFVLGGLYNGVDKPAAADVDNVDGNSGAISRRSIASRSGHRLELFDASGGASGVRLRTGDDKYEINLSQQDGGVTITSDGTVTVDATGNVDISSKGDLSIEVSGALTIKAASIKLEAQSSADVSAATFAVDASGQAQVTSNGTVSVSGSMAELKGTGPTTISGMPVKIN